MNTFMISFLPTIRLTTSNTRHWGQSDDHHIGHLLEVATFPAVKDLDIEITLNMLDGTESAFRAVCGMVDYGGAVTVPYHHLQIRGLVLSADQIAILTVLPCLKKFEPKDVGNGDHEQGSPTRPAPYTHSESSRQSSPPDKGGFQRECAMVKSRWAGGSLDSVVFGCIVDTGKTTVKNNYSSRDVADTP